MRGMLNWLRSPSPPAEGETVGGGGAEALESNGWSVEEEDHRIRSTPLRLSPLPCSLSISTSTAKTRVVFIAVLYRLQSTFTNIILFNLISTRSHETGFIILNFSAGKLSSLEWELFNSDKVFQQEIQCNFTGPELMSPGVKECDRNRYSMPPTFTGPSPTSGLVAPLTSAALVSLFISSASATWFLAIPWTHSHIPASEPCACWGPPP